MEAAINSNLVLDDDRKSKYANGILPSKYQASNKIIAGPVKRKREKDSDID